MVTKKFCDICGEELSSYISQDEVIIRNDNDFISLNYDLCSGCKYKIRDMIVELKNEKDRERKEKVKEEKAEAKRLKELQKSKKAKNDK